MMILSGDQLYRMDYRHLIKTHRETEADVTIASPQKPAAATVAFCGLPSG